MQTIYNFFINKGLELGIYEFFKRIGTWGTLFLFIACGLVILALSLCVLRGVIAIPNKTARIITFIIVLAIIVFGAYICVNLCIQTINHLGTLA